MVPERKVAADKSTRILAKSFYKELRENGYSAQQVLALSTELIDLVTQDVKGTEAAVTSLEEKRAQAQVQKSVPAATGWRQAL